MWSFGNYAYVLRTSTNSYVPTCIYKNKSQIMFICVATFNVCIGSMCCLRALLFSPFSAVSIRLSLSPFHSHYPTISLRQPYLVRQAHSIFPLIAYTLGRSIEIIIYSCPTGFCCLRFSYPSRIRPTDPNEINAVKLAKNGFSFVRTVTVNGCVCGSFPNIISHIYPVNRLIFLFEYGLLCG